MTDVEKRIIVIGSEGHYGVQTTIWDATEMPNIADFGNVVIDTSSLSLLLDQATNIPEKQIDRFVKIMYDNLKYVKERLINVLHAEGKIYVICSPYKDFEHKYKYNFPPYTSYRRINNYDWCPFPIKTLEEKGETIELIDDSFAHYFQFVKRWDLCFEEIGETAPDINEFYQDKYYVESKCEVIAENGYTKPIAVSLRYNTHEGIRVTEFTKAMASLNELDIPSHKAEIFEKSGKLILLPPPTETSIQEAINLLLEDLYGIKQRTVPPKEIEEILVPGEGVVKKKIEDNLNKIRELIAENRDIKKQEEELAQFKQLLYETDTPLEDICKLTLNELGCKTDDSVEDFLLKIDDKEAIVEVKGREKVIERKDGAQLSQNRRNYAIIQEKDMKEVKAILLGNPWRLVFPIEERYKRDFFAPPLVKDAENDGMALVTTIELFKAYCAFLDGKLSSDDIVNRLFSGIGITQLIE